MSTKITKQNDERLREYDRTMLRSAFVSLFWSAISERKRKDGLKLQTLADRLRTNKSFVSRWFSHKPPNWRVDTISDLANVLDLDLKVEAIERSTGTVFTASGLRVTQHQLQPVGQVSLLTTGPEKPPVPLGNMPVNTEAA
jgi:ribosome-binding protein aMBF1 (putative translation factor)